MLNDVAVAVEKLIKEGACRRAMVVDCDLHQGNGTAHILRGKDYALTFSIHQMDIYPAVKTRELGRYRTLVGSHRPGIPGFAPGLHTQALR